MILPQSEDVFVHPAPRKNKRKHASQEGVEEGDLGLVGSVSLKNVMKGVCYAR